MRTSEIYYKLEDSPYIYKTIRFSFYFSSEFYLNKFKDNVYKYVEQENRKLDLRFKCKTLFLYVLMLNYYKLVEKRGFLIIENSSGKKIDKEYQIRGDLIYDTIW